MIVLYFAGLWTGLNIQLSQGLYVAMAYVC